MGRNYGHKVAWVRNVVTDVGWTVEAVVAWVESVWSLVEGMMSVVAGAFVTIKKPHEISENTIGR